MDKYRGVGKSQMKDEVQIRGYKRSDYARVCLILKEAELFDGVWEREDNLAAMVEDDEERILVAEVEGKVVGQIMLDWHGDSLVFLYRLAVRGEFRKKGVGSKLLEEAERIARKSGAEEVGFYVNVEDKRLMDYYVKRGFRKSRDKYFYVWKEIKEDKHS